MICLNRIYITIMSYDPLEYIEVRKLNLNHYYNMGTDH